MDKISRLAASKTPFLFVIDFEKREVFAEPLYRLENVLFKTPLMRNYIPPYKKYPKIVAKKPLSFEAYHEAFMKVIEHIKRGNTYLLNLTFPTPIRCDGTLLDIFYSTKAKYKLYFKDLFCCFSPEPFIRITQERIRTFPMKGTIDATIKDAKEVILADEKEMAEHTMVVDLLRNDLGMVASGIKVNRFRYVEKIVAGSKELLQVSSEIEGKLPAKWRENLGEILDKLLPAGSITGTPKRKTVEIIKDVEGYERGFYTGIFGIFDGYNLDSGVMIRFIEKSKSGLIYKSGGGITIDSDAKTEYRELLDKIYLPL